VNFSTEVTKRPHKINPDTLAKMGAFKMPKITAIGDSGAVIDVVCAWAQPRRSP
jgi:hypothetical protein